MNKKEKKKYTVLEVECYDRDCFVPFRGNGFKICRLYELGQCVVLKKAKKKTIKGCHNCNYWQGDPETIKRGQRTIGYCRKKNSPYHNYNTTANFVCAFWG